MMSSKVLDGEDIVGGNFSLGWVWVNSVSKVRQDEIIEMMSMPVFVVVFLVEAIIFWLNFHAANFLILHLKKSRYFLCLFEGACK